MKYTHLPTPDSFEGMRPAQPKMTVGDYVEKNGFLVPERYEQGDVTSRLGKGAMVLARSEHPDEYAGPSGLGYTVLLGQENNGKLDIYSLESDEFRVNPEEKYYLKIIGIDPADYASEKSYSFWEFVPGVNVAVVADDSVVGRHHVYGCIKDNNFIRPMGLTVDAGDSPVIYGRESEDLTKKFLSRVDELIDVYEGVRTLDEFNKQHCPIIEMQISDDGQIYFLQYHRSRDSRPAVKTLDPKDFDLGDGWVKTEFVRGAYAGGGVLEIAIDYPQVTPLVKRVNFPEDGFYGQPAIGAMLHEALVRHRIAMLTEGSAQDLQSMIAANHGPRSFMFKPEVSVVLGPDITLKDMDTKDFMASDKITRKYAMVPCIKVELFSDGRDAYCRVVDDAIRPRSRST